VSTSDFVVTDVLWRRSRDTHAGIVPLEEPIYENVYDASLYHCSIAWTPYLEVASEIVET
jgi:hypothetical protein